MRKSYKRLLSKINLSILLFGLLVAPCFGQTERIQDFKDTDFNYRVNNYFRTVGSNCISEVFDYDCFIFQFTTIINSNPNDPAAYYIRGQFSIFRQPEQSALDFEKVLEFSPKYMLAYVMRATISIRKKEYDQAIKILTQAIELDPKYANAYTNRGFAYFEQGDFDQAFTDYDKVIELQPKNGAGYVGRAMIYSRQGKFDKAVEYYGKAIEVSPYDWHNFYKRGYLYWQQGEITKARSDCQTAKELQPVRNKSKGAGTYCSL